MKPEDQRVALAEACGWTHIVDQSERLMMPPGFSVVGYPPKNAIVGAKNEIPKYLEDLNACHEAEKMLNEKQQVWYLTKLLQVRYRTGADSGMMACMIDKLAFATAAQRTEALLRTLGLWKE